MDLHENIILMKKQLQSKTEEDTRNNAKFLVEIIKNFSLSFNLSYAQVMEVIFAKTGEQLSIEQVRKELLRLSSL